MAKKLDIDRLKELLSYDPATGVFSWRVSRGRTAKAGDTAGTVNADGYIQIVVSGDFYYAHRLAWAFSSGADEPVEIDHRNGVPSDNRLKNLRPATSSQNKMNTSIRRDNRSGVKGVSWDKRRSRWVGRVKVAGRYVLRQSFDCLDDAASAVAEARTKHHGDFSNGGTACADHHGH